MLDYHEKMMDKLEDIDEKLANLEAMFDTRIEKCFESLSEKLSEKCIKSLSEELSEKLADKIIECLIENNVVIVQNTNK